MSNSAPTTPKTWLAMIRLVSRRCLVAAVLATCAVVLVQTLVVQAFHIPSGSMAPTLHGNHRTCPCPRCGQEVVVGRHTDDRDGEVSPRYYRKAFCPNCGAYPIPVTQHAEVGGDHILVNKLAYLLRAPSRWEVVVFRLLGAFYIKRLLGLPGEEILLHDGDLYVNGKLCRKTYDEARRMRVLIFDQMKAPSTGWACRWEGEAPAEPHARGKLGAKPARQEPRPPDMGVGSVSIDGRLSPTTLTYRNYLLEPGQCEPIRDEYAYNGSVHAGAECVRDFWIETEIAASTGSGTLGLRLCDGHDWIEVVLPVGVSRQVEAFTWPMHAPEQTRKLGDSLTSEIVQAGRPCRVELAFVDRRVSFALDGRVCFSADLPAVKKRAGVVRPFQVHADGVAASFGQFRLYRDVHYGQQGTNAVAGKAVRLGADQYFMLGDNSPNSEDSRYWPDGGAVDTSSLIGPLLFLRGRK